MSQPAATTRRTFHVTFIYGLWSLIGAALSIPAAVYLLLPPRARKQGEWVTAADLDRLPTGAPQEVVFRRNRQDGWKISSEKTSAWLVKTAPDEVSLTPRNAPIWAAPSTGTNAANTSSARATPPPFHSTAK
jgi:hypothetical protein